MDNSPGRTLTAFEIISGGVEIKVKHLDNSEETVKVRQLPLRHIAEYGNIQSDEAKVIELVTGKPGDWVDGLSVESQEALIELGESLNFGPFYRWTERRLKANERLEPLASRVSPSAISAPPSAPVAVTRPSSS